MPQDVVIVMPVLNDWSNCTELLRRIDLLVLERGTSVRILIVDDGSTQERPQALCRDLGNGVIAAVDVLELACNVGHQRALALGIALAAEGDAGWIVVMDSDGEDNPADIERLLNALAMEPDAIAVASRLERSEGRSFKAGYWAYKRLFRLLVGQNIDFGNFSAFGPAAARRLAAMPDTWNHLAASMLRSRLPLMRIPTRRGVRYSGRSTMSFPALIAHGLSALGVYSDHVFARLLLLAGGLGCIAVIGGAATLMLRLLSDIAIPGWASTMLGFVLLLFMQALLLCLVGAIQLLANRSQAGAQPAALLPLFARRTVALTLR